MMKNKLFRISLITVLAAGLVGVFVWALRSQTNDSNQESAIETDSQDDGTSMTANTPASTGDDMVNSAPDTAVSTSSTSPSSEGDTKTVTVTFDGSSYSREAITINVGDTLKFVNESNSRDMWPASNNHPAHTLYPEFDPQQSYGPGESWSFIFSEVGLYPWHDHLNPSLGGTITVE